MMRYHPERENARKPAEMGLDGKSENIKSRLSMCEIEKRQAETQPFASQQEQLFPLHDFTMRSGTVQRFFQRVLPKGAENAIKTAELCRMMGIKDARALRKMISDERALGAVILSGDTGYFLPDYGEKGRQEVAAFIATVTAKGANTIKAVRSAQAFLDGLPGQIEIGGYADGETQDSRPL